jgi:hypothetical protein
MNSQERSIGYAVDWVRNYSKNPCFLYFQYLQKRLRKLHEHATNTAHAVLPDLHIAGGRLGDGCYQKLTQSPRLVRLYGWNVSLEIN